MLVVGGIALAVYISQSLLVIFGALVFASMIDGGARLLGRILPVGRTVRVVIVLLSCTAFMVWLGYFAGSQISREAALLPDIVIRQGAIFLGYLRNQGFAIEPADLQNMAGTVMNGVGTVTSAIGGIFGGFTTLVLIVIIGIYVAMEPLLYERGVAWMMPARQRAGFHITAQRMGIDPAAADGRAAGRHGVRRGVHLGSAVLVRRADGGVAGDPDRIARFHSQSRRVHFRAY